MRKSIQKEIQILILLSPLAVWTGLEPATPCVTGRYSNQLNYHTNFELLLTRWERHQHRCFCECKVKALFAILQIFSRKKIEKFRLSSLIMT